MVYLVLGTPFTFILMGSSRNRVAGHNFERVKAQQQRGIGYKDLRCSRECSRLRDAAKVDLCNADEDEFGRHPYNIQCKSLNQTANYSKLLGELIEHNGEKQINVVFHKLTRKSEKGKFLPVGEYAILKLDDFVRMQKRILDYERFLSKSGVKLKDPINKKLSNES